MANIFYKIKKIVLLRYPAALLYNESIQDEMIEEYKALKRLIDTM